MALLAVIVVQNLDNLGNIDRNKIILAVGHADVINSVAL